MARPRGFPARSGGVSSRSAITELGRSVGLPRGFGPRRDQLEALLRGAAERDQLPGLVDRLAAVCDRAAEVAGDRARATRDGLLALRVAASEGALRRATRDGGDRGGSPREARRPRG